MAAINAELRPAWRNSWGAFVIAGFLLLIALAAAIAGEGPGAGILVFATFVVLGLIVFKRFSWKFTIDENRISRHYGIISRNQQSIRLKDLRSVELDQSLFQRIFGVGNLSFYSAGSADAEVKFIGIKNPVEWRDKIDDAADQA